MSRTILSLVLLFCITITQAQVKTRPVYKDGINPSNAPKEDKLLSEQQKNELHVLISYVKEVMKVTTDVDFTAEQLQAIYSKGKPSDFNHLEKLYNQYQEEGYTDEILQNVNSSIKDYTFFKNNTYSVLNERLKSIRSSTQIAKSPTSSERDKEMALKWWSPLVISLNYMKQLLPNNSDFAILHAEAESESSYYQKYFDEKYAAYAATEMHKRYREQVVLSHTPITYGSENESHFLENVVIDNNQSGLYFMYYGNVPNKEMLNKGYGLKSDYVYAQLQLNSDVGEAIFNGCLVFYDKAYDLSYDEEEQAYLSLPLFPSAETYKRDPWLDPTYFRFIQCIMMLPSDIEHKARVVFGFPGSDKEFDKTFTLTITDEGRANLQKLMDKINYEKMAEVRMGKQGSMHTQENIDIVKLAAEKEGFNIKRIVITGNSYKIFKDPYYPYDIKNKACYAELAYEENGQCYLRQFQIIKEYQGGGTYGKPFVAFKWGTRQGMLCDNVSK